MPEDVLARRGAKAPLALRGAVHGAVVMLMGAALALSPPEASAGRLVLAAALLGTGAGLVIIHAADSLRQSVSEPMQPPPPRPAAPTWRASLPTWKALRGRALAAGGFGLAAAASYLAVGWVALLLFVGAALIAAGWAHAQYLRSA